MSPRPLPRPGACWQFELNSSVPVNLALRIDSRDGVNLLGLPQRRKERVKFGAIMQKLRQFEDDVELPPQEDKQAALRYILDAWEEAVYDGLDPDCIATAAIFAALSDLIATYGEEPVAVMCERLPERIRAGEFTVGRTKQ